MSGTKIAGWLMIVVSVLSVIIDALNGGTFDFTAHYNEILGTLAGAGLIRARTAITKLTTKI